MNYIAYLWYVIKHKWFVMLECFKRGLMWQGLIHDNSKFHPKEFFHYAETFYDKKGKKYDLRDSSGAFNAAEVLGMSWMHHYVNNEHHWQHWVFVEEKYPIRIFTVGTIDKPPVSVDVLEKTGQILKKYVEITKQVMENPKLLAEKTPDPLLGVPHIDYKLLMAMGRKVLPMPRKYVVEMLCDWIGAAKANNSVLNPKGFWIANKDKMELHEDTIKMIEEELGIYEETKSMRILLDKARKEKKENARIQNTKMSRLSK